ncbi:MAG: glycosyltransferase [Bacteroidota bacterium]
MKVSVIISFYNKIEVLKLLLAGFERQSFTNFEVLIADDGSKDEVVKEINEISSSYSFDLKHIWHADNGWQKNIILNKAISASLGEYIVFVDGDCIPHQHFIKDHFNNRENRVLLTGRRVKLSDKLSKNLTESDISEGKLDRRWFSPLVFDFIFGKTKHIEKGFRLWGVVPQVKKRTNPKREVLGCNFSIHKADIVRINGFDERYKGPGIGEDIDIDLRFTNDGGEVRLFKFGAIQYHVYHLVLSRYDKKNNIKIFQENKKSQVAATAYGLKNLS